MGCTWTIYANSLDMRVPAQIVHSTTKKYTWKLQWKKKIFVLQYEVASVIAICVAQNKFNVMEDLLLFQHYYSSTISQKPPDSPNTVISKQKLGFQVIWHCRRYAMSGKNLRCSCFCCSCFQHHNLQHSKPWWKVMDSQWSWSLKFTLVPIDKMLNPFITDSTPKLISRHINNVPKDQKSE